MVLADDSADPRLVAADLLSQAGHDPCAQVLLVTLSRALADGVEAALRASVSRLPRHAIAATALSFARILIVESLDEGIDLANAYAPEHLSLARSEEQTSQLQSLMLISHAVFFCTIKTIS